MEKTALAGGIRRRFGAANPARKDSAAGRTSRKEGRRQLVSSPELLWQRQEIPLKPGA